jgi:hypothetical protein
MSVHNRSQEWFRAEGRSGMVYRSWVLNQGTRGHDVPSDSH